MVGDKKTFPFADVRKVIADEAVRQFGAMRGVETKFHNQNFYVVIPDENYFDRCEVTVNLDTDLYGEQVDGYYINYGSRWSSAEYAEKLAVLLGGAAMIGKQLEKMGVMPRK